MPNITPRRAAAAALLIAAGLALAPEARAAGVPVTLPIVDNSPGTNFTLSGPTDVAQFKINATTGKDLFVGLETFTYLKLDVFDPNGKLVRSYPIYGNRTIWPRRAWSCTRRERDLHRAGLEQSDGS